MQAKYNNSSAILKFAIYALREHPLVNVQFV